MTRDSTVLSRQQFMVGVAGAGVTAPLGSVVRGQAAPASAQFAPPTSGTLGVDMHNHIDVPLAAGDVPGRRDRVAHVHYRTHVRLWSYASGRVVSCIKPVPSMSTT